MSPDGRICGHKNITITKESGGFVRTRLVPIRCHSGTDLTSNKHCLPCDSEKTKMKLNATKDGRKAILHLGGTGKDHGENSSYENHHEDVPNTD